MEPNLCLFFLGSELRFLDLLCFLLQPRGGLQSALKGHAGTLRQIHSQQIIPMEQAMVRAPPCAACIIHAMLSSRFHVATAKKQKCLQNIKKGDFFLLANICSLFFFLVVNNNSGGRKRAKFKVWWLKKKHRTTTATGPVLLFFRGWTQFLFSNEFILTCSSLWLLQARHKLMTRNSAASGGKNPSVWVMYCFPQDKKKKRQHFVTMCSPGWADLTVSKRRCSCELLTKVTPWPLHLTLNEQPVMQCYLLDSPDLSIWYKVQRKCLKMFLFGHHWHRDRLKSKNKQTNKKKQFWKHSWPQTFKPKLKKVGGAFC